MRVERGQHAVDGGLDELPVVGLLDIIGADALEDVAEEIELPIGVAGGGGLRRLARQEARLEAERRRAHAEHRAQEKK